MRMLARLCVAVLLWGSVGGASWAVVPEIGVPQSLPLRPLTVETRNGEMLLRVQVADTDATRQTGLMFRRAMPETEGMLFIFQRTQPLAFWMKNTVLPLDILFVADDGRVMNIARGTTPFSLAPIPSDGPARAVLELNAGASARLGIEVGDSIRYAPLAEPREKPTP